MLSFWTVVSKDKVKRQTLLPLKGNSPLGQQRALLSLSSEHVDHLGVGG